MATRKRRARNEDGSFKGDNPATPKVNEAWEDAPVAEEATPEAPASEEVADHAEPAAEPEAVVEAPKEAPVAESVEAEAPAAATPPASQVATPVPQPQDNSTVKPMTQERLKEIREGAFSAAAQEKQEIQQIIKDAGVESTRGREIAARLMLNAKKRGGMI